jgi:hypothetical protein
VVFYGATVVLRIYALTSVERNACWSLKVFATNDRFYPRLNYHTPYLSLYQYTTNGQVEKLILIGGRFIFIQTYRSEINTTKLMLINIQITSTNTTRLEFLPRFDLFSINFPLCISHLRSNYHDFKVN